MCFFISALTLYSVSCSVYLFVFVFQALTSVYVMTDTLLVYLLHAYYISFYLVCPLAMKGYGICTFFVLLSYLVLLM